MKWPWQGASPRERLVVACSSEAFTYVQASADPNAPAIQRCGQELRGNDSAADFARRVRALGLPAQQVVAVLPLAHCPLLQIEAPAVPPDELKTAARWRIKDMVDAHLDDLTLDVMLVGDDRPRPQKQLFVAAALNSAIEEVTTLMAAAGLSLAAIDIRETAQRNLQSAVSRPLGLHERATAALMVHGELCLLTISANNELFYTRRLEWDETGMARALASAEALARPASLFEQSLHALSADEMPDIVDYGAEPDPSDQRAVEVPRLVIELQRSFDVWERSWPELPLATVMVDAGAHTVALTELLAHELGMRVLPLKLGEVFSGFERATGGREALAAACAPLLGALLRSEPRKP